MKSLEIQFDNSLDFKFQIQQEIYEEKNHLDARWQDVNPSSPINKCWVQGNNNRRKRYQERPCRRLRRDKEKGSSEQTATQKQ